MRTLDEVQRRAEARAVSPDYRTPRAVALALVVLVLVTLAGAASVGASLALAFAR
jgi:hypothetical protein